MNDAPGLVTLNTEAKGVHEAQPPVRKRAAFFRRPLVPLRGALQIPRRPQPPLNRAEKGQQSVSRQMHDIALFLSAFRRNASQLTLGEESRAHLKGMTQLGV